MKGAICYVKGGALTIPVPVSGNTAGMTSTDFLQPGDVLPSVGLKTTRGYKGKHLLIVFVLPS